MAITFGTTGSIFGVPAFTLLGTIQGYNYSVKSLINEYVENESGQKITHYKDDKQTDLTIDYIVNSSSLAISSSQQLVDSVITYNGFKVEINDVKNTGKNKGFLTGTAACVSNQYIALP